MKHLSIFFLALVVCLKLSAQGILSSQLVGTTWMEDIPENYMPKHTCKISFDSKIIRYEAYFPKIDMSLNKQLDFYLTDIVPETFDSTLVGTETRGCYLVMSNRKIKGMSYTEILSLDLDSGDLYLLHRMRPGVIGGRDITTHYKLISKNEETLEADQEAEPEAETPVYTPESIITSLKQMTPEISKIIEELEGRGNIIVDESQRTWYDAQNKQIYIGSESTEEEVLYAIIHYIQDTQGELSYENHSVNNEFEATWLTFLSYFIKYGVFNEQTILGLSSNDKRELEEYLEKSLNCDYGINSYFCDFMDQYLTNDHLDKFSEEKKQSFNNDSSRDEYWHSKDYDYEYNWIQKLKILGFKYTE